MKNNKYISRYYLTLLKNIASSYVIRLDTNVKKLFVKDVIDYLFQVKHLAQGYNLIKNNHPI